MKSLRIFFISALVLAVLFLFRNDLVSFLTQSHSLTSSFFDRAFDYQSFEKLKLENDGLKRELESFKKSPVSRIPSDQIIGQIFSRYPFDGRGLITINLGSNDGVKEDLPVLAAPNILLGRVRAVKKNQSEVITIFDPSWRSSVAIGEKSIKALLHGGLTPTLELITVDAEVMAGDDVLNIAPESPFGLSLGNLGEVKKSDNKLWLSGELKTNYQLDELDSVTIILNFP